MHTKMEDPLVPCPPRCLWMVRLNLLHRNLPCQRRRLRWIFLTFENMILFHRSTPPMIWFCKLSWVYFPNFQEKKKIEEEERKANLQLYVFVCRSIAYPFNAQQSSEMEKRHKKMSPENLEEMRTKLDVCGRVFNFHVIYSCSRAFWKGKPPFRVTKLFKIL